MPEDDRPSCCGASGKRIVLSELSMRRDPLPAATSDTVREALTRVTSILLDLEDQLVHTTADEPHPPGWTSALDDFHTVLVELAKLAAVTSGHCDTWARAHPAADPATLAATATAVEALSHAWDALTGAVEAIGAARDALIRHSPDTGDRRT